MKEQDSSSTSLPHYYLGDGEGNVKVRTNSNNLSDGVTCHSTDGIEGAMCWPRPKQRQRWTDTDHILPSTNWSNIFFDLFYVGGAYNLARVIQRSPKDQTGQAVLYFLGAGLPVMLMWFDKMHYDARFTADYSVLNSLVEVIQLGFVATALSRIRPVETMSNSCEHADMFEFSLALSVASIMTIFRYVDIARNVIGEPAAEVAAKRDIRWRAVPTLWFIAAAYKSGSDFYATNCEQFQTNNVPIIFCLVGWVSWAIFGLFEHITWANKHQYKERFIPMNVSFAIHRYGEWFMLMFGESILSLIIVGGDPESAKYYVTFYSGVISIILLQRIHFRNEPHHSDEHALGRSRHSSYFYTILVPLYSAVLIAIGVSYKMFLYDFVYVDNGSNSRRVLAAEDSAYTGDSSYDSTQFEQQQQRTADLFGNSMALACIFADLLWLLHKGFQCLLKEARQYPLMAVCVITFRIVLIAFLASLSLYGNNPEYMALLGMGLIAAQELAPQVVSLVSARNACKASQSASTAPQTDYGHKRNELISKFEAEILSEYAEQKQHPQFAY